jgi:hypothetical protein
MAVNGPTISHVNELRTLCASPALKRLDLTEIVGIPNGAVSR